MDSSASNKERVQYRSYQGEKYKSEKEEIINPQIDKSKKENINDDNKPIQNYPYEFYDDNNNNNVPIKLEGRDKKILESKDIIKENRDNINNMPIKIEDNAIVQNKDISKNEIVSNEREKKHIKIEEKNVEKIENVKNIKNVSKTEEKMAIKEIVLKNVDKKQVKNPSMIKEQYNKPKIKIMQMPEVPKVKENKKNQEKIEKKEKQEKQEKIEKQEKQEKQEKLEKQEKQENPQKELHKSKFTKKTENNYNIMMKQLKNKEYKNAEDKVISNIFNSGDKMLSKTNNNDKINNIKRKEIIDDFLKRHQDDIKYRKNNNDTINERMKIAEQGSGKRIYFNNKEEEEVYFDEFYNKQIQFKYDCQANLNKISEQINQEQIKNYMPEPKNKPNLDYFKNKNSVELSKYQTDKKLKSQNKKENEKISIAQTKSKKSFNNQQNNQSNINKENGNNKLKESKNLNEVNKSKVKLSQKEIDDLTNKLHYEGELLKVKKQTMISKEFANNPNYHNFSKDKMSRSSIIILIKKLLYEYSTSVKKNTHIDYIKNPKLNYEQYIDILKDLYYLEIDALPEDYLEDDTMYKELWNKLTKFSKGPEGSLESNILLLYILELNGFFRNEKLIKELETEIHWIKIEDYEDLIANAKFIEENWDDLKIRKIENIKKLKSLKKYNPLHYEEFNNNINGNNNTNQDSIDIQNSNHYITIIKGNTNYELIHGYSTKKKIEDNDSFSNLYIDKNSKSYFNSLTVSNNNNMSKTLKNKISLQDGYNDIILKKKLDLENMKQEEEKKFKESCPFKPSITTMSKNMFNNNVKVDLPKYRLNKSVNLTNNKNIRNVTPNNLKGPCQSNNPLQKNQNDKNDKNTNNIKLRKNKSNLEKMFKTNPLKNDKTFNERVQILKSIKSNEINDENYLITPMKFIIDYPSKFEGIGISISRDSTFKQTLQNIIFYNIKINDQIRTMKHIEGEDLKLNVINFVKKNKLPEEVVNIILNKIKEKELEEKKNNN